MNLIVSCVITFIPLLVVFILLKVCNKEFNILFGLLALLLGLLSVLPISGIQFLLLHFGFEKHETLFSMLIYDLILNGFVEELFKMLVLFLLPAKKLKFKDFFICAILCGISLSTFENLIYLIAHTETFGLRIFTSMVIHGCCSALNGVFVFSCKKKHVYLSPFVLSIVIHGIYNYFAGYNMNTFFFYFSLVVILLALVETRIKYKNFSEKADTLLVE